MKVTNDDDSFAFSLFFFSPKDLFGISIKNILFLEKLKDCDKCTIFKHLSHCMETHAMSVEEEDSRVLKMQLIISV